MEILKISAVAVIILNLSCINPFSPSNGSVSDYEDKMEFGFCLFALEEYLIYQERLPEKPYSYDTPQALYASVEDIYTEYLNPQYAQWLLRMLTTQTTGIGIFFDSVYNGIVIKDVFPNSPAKNAGLLEGDTIISVNDFSVAGVSLSEVQDTIRGETGDNRHFTVKRDTLTLSFDIQLDTYLAPSVFSDSLDSLNAYIYLMMFSDSTLNDSGSYGEMKEAIINSDWAQNIIFDLRDNGGGSLRQCIEIVSLFVNQGTDVVRMHERDTLKNSGEVVTKDSVWTTSKPGILTDKKIYILVNENTASASEIVTSCMKEQRSENTTVIGTRTYGKACGQILFQTPESGIAKITCLLIDPVEAPKYNLVGIEPDITISEDEDAKDVALSRTQDSVLVKASGLRKSYPEYYLYEQVKELRNSIYKNREAPGLWIRERGKR